MNLKSNGNVLGTYDSETGSIYGRINKGNYERSFALWLPGERNRLTDGINDVIFKVSSPWKSCAIVQLSWSAKGESSINSRSAVLFKDISSYKKQCMHKESVVYEKSN